MLLARLVLNGRVERKTKKKKKNNRGQEVCVCVCVGGGGVPTIPSSLRILKLLSCGDHPIRNEKEL